MIGDEIVSLRSGYGHSKDLCYCNSPAGPFSMYMHGTVSEAFSPSDLWAGKRFSCTPFTKCTPHAHKVESLAAARKAGSSEPTDAIRAVNALLTQLDALRRFSNVMIL